MWDLAINHATGDFQNANSVRNPQWAVRASAYTANVLPVKNTAIASVTLCTSCWTLEITGLVTTDKTSHFSHYRY